MKINILYFASLREQLGTAQETLETDAKTIGELLQELCQRGHKWQQVLCENPYLQVALNQAVVDPSAVLQEDAEVAFFPPVTGG
jgi:molybdopterin synthase sulfur carrier subunit